MPSSGLSAVFVAHLPAASTLPETTAIEEELRARLDAGEAAWPEIRIDAADFVRYLAERSRGGLPPVGRAADLYFACAGACGGAAVIEAFGRAFRDDIARAVVRIDASPVFLDEVMQVLRVKLFVRPESGPSAIVEYGGRASLRGWLSTVAKRTALNLKRRKEERPHALLESGVAVLGDAAGPETLLLKARYRSEFEAAIRGALGTVPAKERTVLLLHVIDGLTLPQLATLHAVSRATIGRWLTSAREALRNETHRLLTERLRLSPSELESLVTLVQSQVEVNLASIVSSEATRRE